MIPIFLADKKCNGDDQCQCFCDTDRTSDPVDSKENGKGKNHNNLEYKCS